VVAQLQGVIVGIEAGSGQGFRQGDFILNPAALGTAVVAVLLDGCTGRSVSGLGPSAFQPSKYLVTTAFACSGGTLPITTMVVRSGRKACR